MIKKTGKLGEQKSLSAKLSKRGSPQIQNGTKFKEIDFNSCSAIKRQYYKGGITKVISHEP